MPDEPQNNGQSQEKEFSWRNQWMNLVALAISLIALLFTGLTYYQDLSEPRLNTAGYICEIRYQYAGGDSVREHSYVEVKNVGRATATDLTLSFWYVNSPTTLEVKGRPRIPFSSEIVDRTLVITLSQLGPGEAIAFAMRDQVPVETWSLSEDGSPIITVELESGRYRASITSGYISTKEGVYQNISFVDRTEIVPGPNEGRVCESFLGF